jgi:hypothetical protein
MIYALQFLCGVVLLAIVGPFYLLMLGNAVLFGRSEKRRLARGLARRRS